MCVETRHVACHERQLADGGRLFPRVWAGARRKRLAPTVGTDAALTRRTPSGRPTAGQTWASWGGASANA
ncbi:hypothetical protein [Streptomyces sp. NRRL F-2799]|uniref:hypothetical protein n=1 Tax=Streptomyces sp. NRRL F-2799 TaxID=1463844 RepID=UPI0004CBFB45|nr:hypothetical protein [Streptomyces sp. NRRL F-2799]